MAKKRAFAVVDVSREPHVFCLLNSHTRETRWVRSPAQCSHYSTHYAAVNTMVKHFAPDRDLKVVHVYFERRTQSVVEDVWDTIQEQEYADGT